MSIETVAILSPGDMGHAVGRVLRESGLMTITCLEGRSQRTRLLSEQADIENVDRLRDLVARADVVLSIVAPAAALSLARRVAEAIDSAGSGTAFADCNAVSPRSAETMREIVETAGGRFIDASIIGGPPSPREAPRFYASGPHAGPLEELDGRGIVVQVIDDTVGRASGIKMCYAALTKGTSALQLTLLAAAEAMQLTEELKEELLFSQPELYQRMSSRLPALPTKAGRWVAEMEEIAETFDTVGATPLMHRGAADVYRLLSQTSFAVETPESIDKDRDLEETIRGLAGLMEGKVEVV